MNKDKQKANQSKIKNQKEKDKQKQQFDKLSPRARIRRIKTQHDQTANINSDLLYTETKNLHQKSISYATYADKTTDRLFPLKPIQIGFVQSLLLKDDPKFKQIKHLLQKYNQEVKQYDQKSAPGLHLKTKVMDSMLKFMRLMLQAPDGTAKKRILDVSYYWFKKNLDKAKDKKRNNKSLQKQIRQILIQSNLVPKAIIDRQLPSQKQKQQLYHYEIKARTKYDQIDAPSTELQNYITHKLGFVGSNNGIKNQPLSQHIANNKSIEELREQKWKKRIIFKRPYIQRTNYDDLDEQQQRNRNLANQTQTMNNQNQSANIQPQLSQKPKVQGQINPVTGQKIENQNLQNVPPATEPQQQAALDQDLGIPDDNDQPAQQQPVEQEQNKARGKLDPLVKIFLLDRQKRLKTQGQISADKRYQITKNRQIAETKIDQDQSRFIMNWAGNRSRFKSQMGRKIQSIRAFTSISKIKQQALKQLNHTSYEQKNPLRIEHTMNKVRLNQTLKQYGAYLQHEPIRQSLNTEIGMSLYDRKRAKTEVSQTLKPFSSILQDRKRIDQKSQYLEEIHQLKEKFAKYKLYTPLDNFKKAIIHPEQKQCNWAELDKQLREGIELPRFSMISNPFANFGKKKKKKGKKKK